MTSKQNVQVKSKEEKVNELKKIIKRKINTLPGQNASTRLKVNNTITYILIIK